MPNVKNVSYGKPRIGGAIFVAPTSTTLPTDAKSKLNDAFKELGYASEDGVTNTNSPDSDTVKSWGGYTVMVLQNEKADEFTFTLIEATNVEALKMIYGDGNVTGTLETGIKITANATPPTARALVIDMVLQNALKRIVIPNATVSEIGEISYTDSDPIGYETTIQALPDDAGNTHYEYIIGNNSKPVVSEPVEE